MHAVSSPATLQVPVAKGTFAASQNALWREVLAQSSATRSGQQAGGGVRLHLFAASFSTAR